MSNKAAERVFSTKVVPTLRDIGMSPGGPDDLKIPSESGGPRVIYIDVPIDGGDVVISDLRDLLRQHSKYVLGPFAMPDGLRVIPSPLVGREETRDKVCGVLYQRGGAVKEWHFVAATPEAAVMSQFYDHAVYVFDPERS